MSLEEFPEKPTRVSEHLESRRRFYSARLWEASARFWTHPRLAELYPLMLFRMHCMARATVPLMEAAVQRLRTMEPRDEVAEGLLSYFVDHIPREKNHDEWILEDLEALGVHRQELLERLPPPNIASMVGSQYYWIHHHHPIALLGYIAVVEGDPPKPETVEAMIARAGLPRAAFRSYLRHAALEPEHNRLYDELVDRLPLRREHMASIGVSMLHSAHETARSLENLLRATPPAGGVDIGS